MSMPESVTAHSLQQILLVEKDHPHADVIRTEISGRANLRVHTTTDVVNAIRFLSKRDGFAQAPTPDLIILGLELPYFSGMALLQERRRRPSWHTIRVVVLSDGVEDGLSCLAHGADGHAIRPQTAEAWRSLIADILQTHLPVLTPP
jgi:DNA-binding response OmpR family regulator